MRTQSKCAHPLAPTDTAVRRYTSVDWKPSGPISRHQSRKRGCHCSSARCSRLSDESATLFGIFSSSETVLMASAAKRRAQRAAGERSRKGGLECCEVSKVASRVELLRSGAPRIELRPSAGLAVDRQRSGLPGRVGPGEDPVLP